MNSIYVIWQDSESRSWHPVAKLTYDHEIYRLNYTRGVKKAKNFRTFPRMDELEKVYESTELFPFFANRIIQPNRPEFSKILQWTDIPPANFDPLEFLGTTSGKRETDNYRILQTPKREDSRYHFEFFTSGFRYLPKEGKEEALSLEPGDELSFLFEEDNPHDSDAIILKSKRNDIAVGYCPKYLSNEFKNLIRHDHIKASRFIIKKVNTEAPSQYKLLCNFETNWPENFFPFVSEDYLAYAK